MLLNCALTSKGFMGCLSRSVLFHLTRFAEAAIAWEICARLIPLRMVVASML
jgi:hypothetical protein